MSQLGGGGERIRRRDDNAEGKQREVNDGDVKRRRGEDESDVVVGERREFGLERDGERFYLAEEIGVEEAAAGGGVDEESSGGEVSSGGGLMEEGESEFGDG